MDNDIATIDLSKCIDCGICVTSCHSDAITFKLKPDAEIVPHLFISRHGNRSGCVNGRL
ncbi:MAG: 4Fe-4S binding protein [Planctomycetota bacterium]|jgi:ferredoxin